MHAGDGGNVSGAPVLGIEVSYLEEPSLSLGRHVVVTACVESPYDRRITSGTRFWDTSGFSVSVWRERRVARLSLAEVIEGVAFDTVVWWQRRPGRTSVDIFEGKKKPPATTCSPIPMPRC